MGIALDDVKSYAYQDVPESVYQELTVASRPGNFFRLQIRDRYSET